MDAYKLKSLFDSLSPWSQKEGFTDIDWENYRQVARDVQKSISEVVESALELFMKEAIQEEFKGYESESKLFLLMRIVFVLPELAPEILRRSFKGWVNWPEADSKGNVNLSWPISWQSAEPKLIDRYEGSEGVPYSAIQEYRYLLQNFPYRELGQDNKRKSQER